MIFFLLALSVDITEVFVHSSDKKPKQQWFEIYNSSNEPVNLKSAQVRRLDGSKGIEAWKLFLPSQDIWVSPGEYALVVQRRDLGRGLCAEIPIVELVDKRFLLKASGVQVLCLKPESGVETCVPFNNSKKIESDFSRNLVGKQWLSEICETSPGFFASPGLAPLFCEKNILSPWKNCSATEKQEAAVSEAVEIEAPIKHKQLSGGCSQTSAMWPMGFWLYRLCIVCLVLVARYFRELLARLAKRL